MLTDKEQWLIYIMQFVGFPYIWGGKNVNKDRGLDCSGFVEKCLEFFKMQPPYETNAQGMFDYYSKLYPANMNPDFGCLAFFGTAQKIHHIALCLNANQIVEAAHGGPTITTPELAFKAGARIMVTNIGRFSDLYAVLQPSYPWTNSTGSQPTVPTS